MIRAVKTLKGEDFKKMENVLMKPGEFHMPGKKVMQSSDTLAKVVLIDGTPSSRTNGPKKGTQALQRQKEALYPENAVDCRPKAFVYGN